MAQKQSFAVVMLLACFTQTLFAARTQNTQTRVQHTELASDSLETINPFVRAVRNLMAVRTLKLKQQQQQLVAGSAEQLREAMGGPKTIFCCCGWMAACKDRESDNDDFVGLKIGKQEMCCVASHIYMCQGRNQLFPFMLHELLPAIKEAAPGLLVISNEGSETTQGHCPVQKSIEDEAKPTEIEAKPTPQCHTATTGEDCYNGVQWAMREGIHNNPEWYPGLTSDSSFEDFQKVLYRGSHSDCPLPCPQAVSQ